MNEFFTWELLATYTGACLGTGVVTELLKGLFPAAPGRLLGYLTAAALLLLAQLFTGGSPSPAGCWRCSTPPWWRWPPAAGTTWPGAFPGKSSRPDPFVTWSPTFWAG